MADEKDPGTPPESGGESDAAARSEADSPTSPSSPTSAESPESPTSPESVDAEFEGIVADADEPEDGELVGVGAKSSSKKASRGEDSSEKSGRVPVKKDRPTAKQRSGPEEQKRVGPVGFVKGSISELKKVVYPTGSQLGNYFIVVLVFVLIIIGIVTALDAGFGWLVLQVFT